MKLKVTTVDSLVKLKVTAVDSLYKADVSIVSSSSEEKLDCRRRY